jgi:hypothetical protein
MPWIDAIEFSSQRAVGLHLRRAARAAGRTMMQGRSCWNADLHRLKAQHAHGGEHDEQQHRWNRIPDRRSRALKFVRLALWLRSRMDPAMRANCTTRTVSPSLRKPRRAATRAFDSRPETISTIITPAGRHLDQARLT